MSSDKIPMVFFVNPKTMKVVAEIVKVLSKGKPISDDEIFERIKVYLRFATRLESAVTFQSIVAEVIPVETQPKEIPEKEEKGSAPEKEHTISVPHLQRRPTKKNAPARRVKQWLVGILKKDGILALAHARALYENKFEVKDTTDRVGRYLRELVDSHREISKKSRGVFQYRSVVNIVRKPSGLRCPRCGRNTLSVREKFVKGDIQFTRICENEDCDFSE